MGVAAAAAAATSNGAVWRTGPVANVRPNAFADIGERTAVTAKSTSCTSDCTCASWPWTAVAAVATNNDLRSPPVQTPLFETGRWPPRCSCWLPRYCHCRWSIPLGLETWKKFSFRNYVKNRTFRFFNGYYLFFYVIYYYFFFITTDCFNAVKKSRLTSTMLRRKTHASQATKIYRPYYSILYFGKVVRGKQHGIRLTNRKLDVCCC